MFALSGAVAGANAASDAMLIAVKPFLVIAIVISSSFTTTADAAGADLTALPPDAELTKWIVGTWKVDLPPANSAARFAYETYAGDGTFKHFAAVQEGSAPAKLLVKASGTWNVQGGFLVSKIAASNLSAVTGRVYRDRIESANRDSFVVREAGSARTRRRAQLPADLVSGGGEVPKLFTVEEAAQVLRYAVRPEYSYDARRTKASGTGLFELRFDYETGRLKAIDIVQSSGSRILDHDAINGLKEWKAKPHSIRVMRIPITFKLH
ncbi:MAG: TonB family protein [Chthoniobacterales bacterium]